MFRVHSKYTVERFASLPVFVPSGLVSENAQLQPHVIEVDLSEEKQRRFIVGAALQPCPRKDLTPGRLFLEVRQE